MGGAEPEPRRIPPPHPVGAAMHAVFRGPGASAGSRDRALLRRQRSRARGAGRTAWRGAGDESASRRSQLSSAPAGRRRDGRRLVGALPGELAASRDAGADDRAGGAAAAARGRALGLADPAVTTDPAAALAARGAVIAPFEGVETVAHFGDPD